MNNIVEIKDMNLNLGSFSLKNINLNVEEGAIVGIVGKNGAGKTTLIKSIMNSMDIDSGKIMIFGKDNVEDEVYVKNYIGYVADEDYLQDNASLTFYANAFSKIYEEWDAKILNLYIEKWKLPRTKQFSEYSKGMKRLAMFALALAHKPKLLIFDETTAGLDPVARAEILGMLRDFVADGDKSVLFSSHITSDLDKIADYLVMIDNGEIVEEATIDDIESRYVVVSGSNDLISKCDFKLIGLMKGNSTFEALAYRKDAASMQDINKRTPNIENVVTFILLERGKGSN